MSDLAYDCGLALPDLAPDTVAQLDRLLGIGTSVGNPLDTGFSGLSSQETLLNVSSRSSATLIFRLSRCRLNCRKATRVRKQNPI